jgi:hypothetical protein
MRTASALIGICAAAILILFFVPMSDACDVPVFRYALERWPPDAYEAYVLHRGALSSKDNTIVEDLQKGADGQPANLKVETIDLEKRELPKERNIQAPKEQSDLPWLVVYPPMSFPESAVIWSGHLKDAPVKALIDSPLRRQISKRLMAGDVAVFVFLECGIKKKDDEAFALVEAAVKGLPKTVARPNTSPEMPEEQSADNKTDDLIPVSFTLLRLSRDDPQEKIAVEVFLQSEADLKSFTDPIVFPVYGRGRALYAFVGKGINEDNIRGAFAFLTGPCSCQIKEQNPGTDLLLAADWEGSLSGRLMSVEDAPPLVGISQFVQAPSSAPASAPSTSKEINGAPPPASNAKSGVGGGLLFNVLIVVLICLAAVVAGTIAVKRHGKS